MQLRVYLADDHPVVLCGVKAILQNAGLQIVGEVRSTDEAVAGLETTACDVLVTDLVMPGGRIPDGAAYIQLLRQRFPLLPIVVLTMISNLALIDTLLRSGVLAVVEKGEDMSNLATAVRSAVHRRSYTSPYLRAKLDALGPHGRTGVLSTRETEVIRMLTSGLTATQIAATLGRSLKTISRQKMTAMQKLGLSNDAQLYVYAREHGLL